jgi:hypothetical protein
VEEAEEGLTGNFSRLQQMEAERKAERTFHWARSDDHDPNGADAWDREEGASSCRTTSIQEIQREKRAPQAPPAKHVSSAPQSFLRRTVTSGSMQVAQQGSNGEGLKRTASAPGPGDTREERASSENACDEECLPILPRSLFPRPRPTTTTQFRNNNVELNRLQQTRSPQAFSRKASDSTHSIRTDMFPALTGPPPVLCTPRVPQHSEQGDARLVCLIVRVLCVGTECVQHVACDPMLATNLAGGEGAARHQKSISSVCSPSILRVLGQKERPASAMPDSRRQKLSSDTMDDWCKSNFSATAPCLSTAPLRQAPMLKTVRLIYPSERRSCSRC